MIALPGRRHFHLKYLGYIAFLLLLLILAFTATAQQQPIPDWINQIGGNGESKVTGIAVDQANNVYVAGDFRNQLTVDFSGISTPVLLSSNGNYDIFIAKYTPDGRLLWAKSIGGDGWDQVNNIAVDNNGNVLLSGYFQSSLVDCDPGPGLANFASSGGADAIVVKFDTDGEYTWARSVSGSGEDFGHQVYTDVSGNVIFTGSFSDIVNLAGNKVLRSTGDLDAFIVKYDSSGNLLWAYNMGNDNTDEFTNVKVNSNQEIFVIGYFNGDVDLNPKSPGNITINPGKTYFLCKYAPSGELMWTNKIAGNSDPTLSSLAVSNTNSVFVTGVYNDQLTFNAQTSGPLALNYPGRNLFLTKYNDSGNPVWASNITTGSNATYSYCITADIEDNVYMSGFFEGGLTFGSGANIKTLSNSIGRDTYCAKYDGSGNYVWAFNLSSTCVSNYGHKIAVDGEKHVLMGGMFCGTVDFNPGNCTLDAIANDGVGDGYLVKYNQVNLNGAPVITSASLLQETAPAVIDAVNKTITITVAAGTDLRSLKPKLTTDIGILTPLSDEEVDLTNPKVYTISSNCLDYSWTLIVTAAASGHVVTQANAGTDISLCNGAEVTLNANAPAIDETGTWSVVSPTDFQPFNDGNRDDPHALISNLPQDQEVILKWTISYAPEQLASSDLVTVNAAATIANAGQDAILCGANAIQLDANPPAANEIGTWSVQAPAGYDPFSGQNIHDPKALISGIPQNKEIRLTWTIESQNCNVPNSDGITILSHQDISLNAHGAYTINYGEKVYLNATANLDPGTNYTIEWSPKRGLSSYNTLNPLASPDENTTYTITISYGQGCAQTAFVTVKVLNNIELPNTFSPNHDGINDTWEVTGIGNYPGSVVSVYNRYGTLLYRSIPGVASWDGTYKGKQLPVGAYFYVAKINDKAHAIYKGIITILR